MPEPTGTPAPAEPTITPTPADVAGQSTPGTDPQAEPDPAGAEALGDPGKRALDIMKAERHAAREEARQAKADLAAAQAKIAGTEAEHAAQVERQRVQDEAIAKANERVLRSNIKTAAKGALADPADALKFIDLTQFEADADGEFDEAAITAAIEKLAKEKPYLAAQSGGPGTVFESPGAHRTGAPAGQLTQAEVARMYAEKRYDDIEKARQEGRLTTLLGAKP